MKVALITDTHWGIRTDSIHFIDNNKKFLDEIFFPYIDKHKIKQVVHLGDLVDRRKYINYLTAYRLRTDFIEPLLNRNVQTTILLGNHDIFWRERLDINAIHEMVGDRNHFNIVDKPTVLEFDGLPIQCIPWICDENKKEVLDAIVKSSAPILFGHLELNGFEMHKGIISEQGMDHRILDKFELVCTGHFHRRSVTGNIHYLGAMGEYTWSDYADDRGFNVFDTETRELEFIRNPFSMFAKVYYDDVGRTKRPSLEGGGKDLGGKIVKVIVKSKTNTEWFDGFITKLEKSCPIDIQVVDDHLNLDLVSDASISTEAKDTLTIFKEFILQANNVVNSDKLDKFVTDLYTEALALE
jgi:hypothetical protein